MEKCAQSDAQEESDELEEQEKLRIREIHKKLEEIKKRKLELKSNPQQDTKAKESKNESNQEKSKQGSKAQKNKPERLSKILQINELREAKKALSKLSQITSALEKRAQSHPDKVINISDPDAALMRNKGLKQAAYNAQIVSSLDSQVIVAADLTNQENDQAQLEPMLKQLKSNVSAANCDDTAQSESLKILADAGYNKGSNLESVDQDKQIDAYISMKDRSKDDLSSEDARFLKENFSYDEDKDEWLCPRGEALENYGNEIRNGKSITVYAGCRNTCLRCPLYSKCVKSKRDIQRGYRTLEDDGFLIYRKQMRQKMDGDEAKEIYPKRSQVEAVFGQIKANRGFCSFRLRGLRAAKAEFMLMSLAHNMGKLMNYLAKGEDLVRATAY